MFKTIDKDKTWLNEQIDEGIQAFIDNEGEYLKELLKRYILQQIFLSGCALNAKEDQGPSAELTISISIPQSIESEHILEDIHPVSAVRDGPFW